MAIIYTYPTTTTLENSDLFVISKMQQEGKPTRSISAANLASFIAPLIPVTPFDVTGSGITNYIPKWTDGPNSILGDSPILTVDGGAGLKQAILTDGYKFVVDRDAATTAGDPEYSISQNGVNKTSFGWDDDGGGFGFLYNWSGKGFKFGSTILNPQLELLTDPDIKTISYADFEFDADVIDITGSVGTAGQVLSSLGTGNGVQWTETGTVTGTGTTNTLPMWSDGPNGILTDSKTISYDSANERINITVGVVPKTYVFGSGFFGNGSWQFQNGFNGGFYRAGNFRFEQNLAVGRNTDPTGATLDVGTSTDTSPAAWFRNGVVISNNPSGVNVDNTSVVIGAGNNDIVSGSDNCLTVGNNNQILSNSDNAVAFGLGNTISNGAASSFAVGQGNTIDGTGIPGGTTVRSQIIGLNNSLTGSFASFIAGGNNTVTTEQNAMVLGFGNTTNGVDNVFAIGESNTLADATANGVFMIGNGITGQDGNMVLGFRNDTASYPATNYALGLGNTKLVLGVGTVNDSNAIIITEGGVTRGGGIAQEPRIVMPSIVNFNFTSDVDAANNGIPVGGIYHNAGEVRIRIV